MGRDVCCTCVVKSPGPGGSLNFFTLSDLNHTTYNGKTNAAHKEARWFGRKMRAARDGARCLYLLVLAGVQTRTFAGEFAFVAVRGSGAQHLVGCMPASFTRQGPDIELPLVRAQPMDGCTAPLTGFHNDAFCLLVSRG